jgi:hypothetical protein
LREFERRGRGWRGVQAGEESRAVRNGKEFGTGSVVQQRGVVEEMSRDSVGERKR